MELTTGILAVIIITSLISSILSLGAKLMYDGIKAKKNGNSKSSNSNGQVSVNLALLVKDIDFNNKKLAEIERGVDRLVEHSVVTNIHLQDLKQIIDNLTSELRSLGIALTSVIAKLE